MGVDDGVKVERGRRSQGFGSVNLEGVVVGGGEEGKGVERVEGQMGDAEIMRQRRSRETQLRLQSNF